MHYGYLSFVPHSYNKKEEDFPTLREYNDYLEEIENIGESCPSGINKYLSFFDRCHLFIEYLMQSFFFIYFFSFAVFNLTNGIDVEETKRKVELYKKENQEFIRRNRSKMVWVHFILQSNLTEISPTL